MYRGGLHQGACMQVIVSVAEHHANIVPWQIAAKKAGAVLRHVPLTRDTQEVDMQVGSALLPCCIVCCCRWSPVFVKGL